LNVSIYNLIKEYINPKNKEEAKSKDNDDDNNDAKNIKRKKYINKRKVLINNSTADFPLENNSDCVKNSEISK